VSDTGYIAWKGWSDAAFGSPTRDDELYFANELARCGLGLRGARVAELGFGNGAFAGWCRAHGATWSGAEQNALLVERARAQGLTASTSLRDLGAGHDLVVAFDVLEHMDIAAIQAALTDAYAALDPGGHFLGRIPSGDSPFSGGIFHGDLTHRSLLGSTALRELAMRAGFDVVQVRETAFPVRGYDPRRFAKRLAAKAIRAVAFAVVRNAIMVQADAVVSPNMTFLLRRPG